MDHIRNVEKAAALPLKAGEAVIRGIAIPLIKTTVRLLPYNPSGEDSRSAEVIPLLRDSRGTPLQGWADTIESRQPAEPSIDLRDQPLPPKKRFQRAKSARPVDRIYD